MIDLTKTKVTFLPESVKRIPEVDDSDYFGEAYKQYVSNSSLKYLNPDEGGSAYAYINRVSNQSNSLELGTAVHRTVLEGDKYVLSEVNKPSGKLSGVIEAAYILCKRHPERPYSHLVIQACGDTDYYGKSLTEARIQSAIEDGREYFEFLKVTGEDSSLIILSPENKSRLLKATQSIKENSEITALLKPSESFFDVRSFSEDVITIEVLVEFEEPGEFISSAVVTQVDLKCKIDNWSIDLDNKVITLNDLKTSGAPIQGFMGKWVTMLEPECEGCVEIVDGKKFIPGSFQKWHYHRQMGMYAAMLTAHCVKEFNIDNIDDWTINVNMIVAETIAPFNAYTFAVTKQWLDAGIREMNSLLGRLAWHKIYGFDKVIEFDTRTV
jgi:hypothetical protein